MLKILEKILSRQNREQSFQEKFDHFQALLSANDSAHKSMSEMIEIISEGQPFSEGYMDRLFHSLLSDVDLIAKHLSGMSEGKHQVLRQKVNEIEKNCYEILSPRFYCEKGWDCDNYDCHICPKAKEIKEDSPYFYRMSDIDNNMSLEVGSKMSRLGEIRNILNIPVPDGFCLTARLFEDYMAEDNLRTEIGDILYKLDYDNVTDIQAASRNIQALLVSSNIPAYLEEMIEDAFKQVFSIQPGIKLSVRSSALGEDSDKYSFAGLHRTELNIGRENLVDACWEVLISKYSPQSLVYRYISGLRDEDMPMSVGCIEMLDATSGGVLFTNDPNNKKEGIIIQGVYGLGSLVVSGEVTPQEFITSHSYTARILDYSPGRQTFMNVVKKSEGIEREHLPEDLQNKPCLTDVQIKTLVKYALDIEQHFRCPMDIEWATDKAGKVYILQARPLKIECTCINSENFDSIEQLDKKYEVLVNKGDCASRGVKHGTAYVIHNLKDMMKFPNGGIIVATKNLPEFASLIHKASGVITDTGSTTGHLSIIARELNVPVLTNTGNASEIIKTGMEITINTEEKRVYLGIVPELFQENDIDLFENLFRTSPLYKIWHRITKFIFKLNLTDPDSPKFEPEYCSTLHDIIRYSHEMAMRMMFSIYKNTNVESGKAFLLKFEVPLEIYVIDLGNSIAENLGRNWLTPEEVNSKPFRELIRGMTTPGIKWAGHLAMDTKGYASLIFGNIVDVHRSESGIGSTSYVLVSDCYLNFFSRLGYHFSRLDAFACKEINSNYINFNFRGGAADPVRRARRVTVIKRILEHYSFSVSLADDNLIATIRKVPEEQICELLAILGRLMGAVRNTDVTMVSEEYMNEFVKVFIAGDPAPALKLADMWK